MKITTEITIKAPTENVFSVFTDLDHATERIKGIESIEVLEGPAQMKVGTKWKEKRTMFGKEATETMWVTALNPSKSYVVEANSHGMKYRSEYTFTSTEGETHVKLTFEGLPQTLKARVLNIIFSFMAGTTQKMLQQDMEDLKKICESPQKTSQH